MIIIALFLAVLGTGNPWFLWERCKDQKSRQTVLSESSDNVVVYKVATCNGTDEIATAAQLPAVAAPAPAVSVAAAYPEPPLAAPPSSSTARASPSMS